MAQGSPTGAADNTSACIFAGKRFFVLQKVPLRSQFVQTITDYGGQIVRLESQADYKIADHARRDNPPGSISYKFIEDAVKQNAIPNPSDFACTAGAGPARPAGSAAVRRKPTRNMYTEEEDKLLIDHLRKIAQTGMPIMGNVPYQEMEKMYPRHSWQSWRSRYVDVLQNKTSMHELMQLPSMQTSQLEGKREPEQEPRVSPKQQQNVSSQDGNMETDVTSSNASRSEEVELTPEQSAMLSALETRQPCDSNGQPFTSQELIPLIMNLEDIPYITHGSWHQAWTTFAEETGNSHSADDWKTLFATHVQAIFIERHWNEKLEDGSPEKRSMTPNSRVLSSQPSVVDETPSKNPPQTLKRKASSPTTPVTRKAPKLTPVTARRNRPVDVADSDAQSAAQVGAQQLDSVSEHGSSSRSDQSSRHTRERVDWAFDQALQKKRNEEASLASIISPGSHPLTAANLATQSQQQAMTRSQATSEGRELSVAALNATGQNTDALNSRVVSDESLAPHSSQDDDLDAELLAKTAMEKLTNGQHASVTQSDTNGNGTSFDSALLSDEDNVEAEQESAEEPSEPPSSIEVDLSVPSPVKPVTKGKEKLRSMDTQAILNAETQMPDLSMPMPDGLSQSSQSYNPAQLGTSQESQGSRRKSPVRPTTLMEPVDDAAIEAFFDDFGKQGYEEADIAAALHMTSARPDLAEYVLSSRKEGLPIPDDLLGFWTAEDDEIALGGDGRKLRALEAKHGTDEFYARLKFLSDLADDSQE